LVAVANDEPLGVITKLDLLEYLARGGKHGA
jgi:CBS domain-containing protein